jgi:hypothetical protein
MICHKIGVTGEHLRTRRSNFALPKMLEISEISEQQLVPRQGRMLRRGWLRHCATNRKGASSILDEIIEFLIYLFVPDALGYQYVLNFKQK